MSASGRDLWRLVRQPTGTVESDLHDIRTSKAANRYASHFEAVMDDPTGDKAADYPRGQRAIAEYSTDGGTTWTAKQAGFVQKPGDGTEGDETGSFSALFIGYDHLLRREPVYVTFAGVTVSSALNTVVTQFTPVNWNAANVTVSNDTTVSREFKGERPDEVISWLAEASGNEEFGVNEDFEFYFRPRETRSAPGNILNGEWYGYDLPTEGRHAVNAARVFYGDGTATARSSVIVEDRVAQRELKTSLGGARRVVFGEDVHYPEIDNREAARIKGQEILSRKSPVLTGSVDTFRRFDWEPGDVFRLEIPEKGIDDSFAVAEVQHEWGGGTRVKVAQNTNNVQDLLNVMSDDIVRVDLRDADPDATYSRFLDLNLGVTVSIDAEVRQREVAATSFVAGFGATGDEAGFTLTQAGEPQAGFDLTFTETTGGAGAATTTAINQMRDVWQGASPAALTQFKAGTGTSPAVRTDTDLETGVTGLLAATQVVNSGDYAVSFQKTLDPGGAFTGTTFTEFGFFDANSAMHNRATLDAGVTHTGDTQTQFFVTFTIDTDPTAVGVVTNTGQRRLRDMYLNEVAPATYATSSRAYGTGTTAEAEGDTALATPLGEKALTHADAGTGRDVATMELLTSEANGNSLAEFGDENSVNELLTRVTFEPLAKTTDFALVSELGLTVRPVIL